MEIIAKFANLVPERIGAIKRSHQMGNNHAIMHDNGAAESSQTQWLGIRLQIPKVAITCILLRQGSGFINLYLDSNGYNITTSSG